MRIPKMPASSYGSQSSIAHTPFMLRDRAIAPLVQQMDDRSVNDSAASDFVWVYP